MDILEDIFRKYLFKGLYMGAFNIFKFIFSYLKEMSGKI